MRVFLDHVYQNDVEAIAGDAAVKGYMVRFAKTLMGGDDPMGFYYMGAFYENGIILPENGEKAAQMYIKAIDT